MDPVSHVIFGRTIVAALEKPDGSRLGRGAGAAAILGALSPDADSVLMPAGWDIHLRFHEIGTHSLAGSILERLHRFDAAAVLARSRRRGAFFLAGADESAMFMVQYEPVAVTRRGQRDSHEAIDVIRAGFPPGVNGD